MPGLVEVLSGGVQFVQELGDPWHQALCVGVTHPTAVAAATATTAAAASTVTIGKGLAALDSLEQPVDRLDACCCITLAIFYDYFAEQKVALIWNDIASEVQC